MCDCSTYLAVRRGRRSFREQVRIAVCFHAARTCTTARVRPTLFSLLLFILFLPFMSPHLVVNFSSEQKERFATTARNQPRYESADISPTGCEVRARINQAAQLGRLYSQNLAILLLESVPRENNGIHLNYELRDTVKFLFVLTRRHECLTTRKCAKLV